MTTLEISPFFMRPCRIFCSIQPGHDFLFVGHRPYHTQIACRCFTVLSDLSDFSRGCIRGMNHGSCFKEDSVTPTSCGKIINYAYECWYYHCQYSNLSQDLLRNLLAFYEAMSRFLSLPNWPRALGASRCSSRSSNLQAGQIIHSQSSKLLI